MKTLLEFFTIHYYTGFRALTLGWSDGNTLLPLNFAFMASSKKKKYQNGQECYFNLKVGPKKVTLKKKVILMSKFQETDQTIQQAFFKVLAAEPFETITINSEW